MKRMFNRDNLGKVSNYGVGLTLVLLVVALLVGIIWQGNSKGNAVADAAVARQDATIARADANQAREQLTEVQLAQTCFQTANREASLAILGLLALFRGNPQPEAVTAAYQRVEQAKVTVEASAVECGDKPPPPPPSGG